MACKCNKLIIGLSAGLVLPVLGAYIIYLAKYSGEYNFVEFINGLMSLKSLGKLISISVLFNLIAFILSITYEKYIMAKGLVVATAFWVLVVVAVKFLV